MDKKPHIYNKEFPATDCAMYGHSDFGNDFCKGLNELECRYGICHFYKSCKKYDYQKEALAKIIKNY